MGKPSCAFQSSEFTVTSSRISILCIPSEQQQRCLRELKNPEDEDPHVANDIGINVRRVVDDPNPQPMETIDIPEDALFAVHVIGDDRELDAEAVEFLAERPGPGPAEPAE